MEYKPENMDLLSGIIIIDKPAEWTSHDVVAKLRGVLKQKRIGHGGTLDPMATGVLPVFVGRSTRAAEFCENAEKEYIAEITLGIVTDTQDITGNVLCENEVNVTCEDLVKILPQFMGQQKQIPPMYSAIKRGGKKLYELARKGIDVPREARDIYISALDIIEEQIKSEKSQNETFHSHRLCDAPHLAQDSSLHSAPQSYSLRVVCSKGTYIRTLCHDIGVELGCGGTLSALRRTRAGVFSIDTAHTLDDVIAAAMTDTVNDVILPVDSIFAKYPAITVSETEAVKAKNGAVCKTPKSAANGKYRVYAQGGEFLLLGEIKNNNIHTIKSFFNP